MQPQRRRHSTENLGVLRWEGISSQPWPNSISDPTAALKWCRNEPSSRWWRSLLGSEIHIPKEGAQPPLWHSKRGAPQCPEELDADWLALFPLLAIPPFNTHGRALRCGGYSRHVTVNGQVLKCEGEGVVSCWTLASPGKGHKDSVRYFSVICSGTPAFLREYKSLTGEKESLEYQTSLFPLGFPPSVTDI